MRNKRSVHILPLTLRTVGCSRLLFWGPLVYVVQLNETLHGSIQFSLCHLENDSFPHPTNFKHNVRYIRMHLPVQYKLRARPKALVLNSVNSP